MATDSIAELKDQIEASLEVLEPQIEGNEDLIRTSVSNDLVAAIRDPPLVELYDRKSKCQSVLDIITELYAAIEILEEDGWPEPQTFSLPAHLLAEYKGQLNDLAAGASVFKLPAPATMASQFELTEGQPIPKRKE